MRANAISPARKDGTTRLVRFAMAENSTANAAVARTPMSEPSAAFAAKLGP
jgi:hypothetical protein